MRHPIPSNLIKERNGVSSIALVVSIWTYADICSMALFDSGVFQHTGIRILNGRFVGAASASTRILMHMSFAVYGAVYYCADVAAFVCGSFKTLEGWMMTEAILIALFFGLEEVWANRLTHLADSHISCEWTSIQLHMGG